jgi:hypothetical protein
MAINDVQGATVEPQADQRPADRTHKQGRNGFIKAKRMLEYNNDVSDDEAGNYGGNHVGKSSECWAKRVGSPMEKMIYHRSLWVQRPQNKLGSASHWAAK